MGALEEVQVWSQEAMPAGVGIGSEEVFLKLSQDLGLALLWLSWGPLTWGSLTWHGMLGAQRGAAAAGSSPFPRVVVPGRCDPHRRARA